MTRIDRAVDRELPGDTGPGLSTATMSGNPTAAPVWQNIDLIPAWLDRARKEAPAPPDSGAKAAEWLRDNEYRIRRAVRQIRSDLPESYYRRLRRLEAPEAEGLPRILMAAHEQLRTTRIHVSRELATDFMEEYQHDDPLDIAELWAFPSMLRLACLETIVVCFSDLFPGLAPPFEPLPGSAARGALDPTEAVSRAITALGAISSIPWKRFFESTSRVESVLRDDPSGLYSRMEFDTRDRYRKSIEDLAAGCDQSEWEVASRALELARTHRDDEQRGHVGWWLADDGWNELANLIDFHSPTGAAVRRWILAHAGMCYATMLTGFTLVALSFPPLILAHLGTGPSAWLAAIVLALMPAMIIGTTLTQWIACRMIPPRPLAKLDFRNGLPEGHETALVVPAIFGSEDEVSDCIKKLEMHWLANPDPRLRIALLSDLRDAATPRTARDDDIEATLCSGINRLNARYADTAPFVLLHRARLWNPSEGCWMGWERKRGKLQQFNDFLAGEEPDAFPVTAGDMPAIRGVRHVITLDSDTTAPPGTVGRLVGTLAHPLNHARFDPERRKVTRGYTFIQPRIEISPEAGDRTLFSRLYAGDTAIDVYSRAVSDVYQDLFGEGIFTGKGAYNFVSFRQSLSGRVPQNALLSHDLFEGLHGRAALASDIVLYEDFPSSYSEYHRRWHRWVRGDWQLFRWLGRRVPGAGGKKLASPLSALDRWKLLDNLRRSLNAPSMILFAVVGWLAFPDAAPLWSLLAVAAPGAYLVTDVLSGISSGPRRDALRVRLRQLLDHAGRWFLAVVFMANDAAVASDAILRTIWRTFVSEKHLLEWTTAAHVAKLTGGKRLRCWTEMAAAPAIAIAIGLSIQAFSPAALPGAAPLLLLWLLSPEIAYFTGQQRRAPRQVLRTADIPYLRRVARRTWLFFETFGGPADNWLPPDNYQTEPYEELAHRTSPTNIGMLFLSSLTAWDLGHVGLCEFAARTRHSLDTLDRMEQHHGHILNWCDTRSLEPLEPCYVSTVDSGNLACSLLALREGCIEAARGPAIGSVLWNGLDDLLALLEDSVAGVPLPQQERVLDQLQVIRNTSSAAQSDPSLWRSGVQDIRATLWPGLMSRVQQASETEPEHGLPETALWLERAGHHLSNMSRDFHDLFPWLDLIEKVPEDLKPLGDLTAALLNPAIPLDQIGENAETVLARLSESDPTKPNTAQWLTDLNAAIIHGTAAQRELANTLHQCAADANKIAMGMDFGFLYDRETRTFFIGYNVSLDRMDTHHYDLLASEARLSSFFAIAKRDVPVDHWIHLGRPVSVTAGKRTILSWNGSMFEYLMPPLLLRCGDDRLLGHSEHAAVVVQKHYGDRLSLPWGVSESAFASRDAAHRYQYRAFGVDGLGLRTDLSEDYVVAPYATALALAVAPVDAVDNLLRLEGMGATGRYGFFDAVDFTPDRRSGTEPFVPVRAFMAHHQGMLLTAIGNALNDDAMVRRFMADPQIRSMELLLQERVPWEQKPEVLTGTGAGIPDLAHQMTPRLHGWTAPDDPPVQVHAIGNGHMSSWVTDAGGGALWMRDVSLTRWTGDPARDEGGMRVYLRDTDTDAVWSIGRHTPGAPLQDARVEFFSEKVEFHQHVNLISASLEILVAEADDVEIRRVTLVNESANVRTLEVTSYAEVVLAQAATHERHPAFNKLFIRSEWVESADGLLFSRRPKRPEDQHPLLLFRLLCPHDDAVVPLGFETDRRAFVGRLGDMVRPEGLATACGNTDGWSLDPVAALRAKVRLEPGTRQQLAFIAVAAATRHAVLANAKLYGDLGSLDWAFEDTERAAAVQANRLGLTTENMADAQAQCRNLLLPSARASSALQENLSGQPDLWGMGLSGDLPIALVRVDDTERADLLSAAVRIHQWWRRNALRCDMVILATVPTSYEEPLRERLHGAMRELGASGVVGGHGGVHILRSDRLAPSQLHALTSLANVEYDAAAPTLTEGYKAPPPPVSKPPHFVPGGEPAPWGDKEPERPSGLMFDNGYGGFSEEGTRYLIHLEAGQNTPVPWCNILANETFGSIVSEAGLGFTWAVNSGEHRLTPWSNDPVSDPQNEAIYLRDEETGSVWTPTPSPAGMGVPCQIEHRPGSTTWSTVSHGLEHHLTVLVPPDAPVKLAILQLSNHSGRDRRLTATYFAEWLMGALSSTARRHVLCEFHPGIDALVARNAWAPDFRDRVAFLTASHPPHSITCERLDFLGRANPRSLPEGLTRWDLGGRANAASDPCAGYQVHVELAAGQTEEVIFVLGEGCDLAETERLADMWSAPDKVHDAMTATQQSWERRLGAIKVSTPDHAFDLLINRWLLYQTLSSRIFARAGFSQASGGIGFRDQLQDVLALLHSEPERVQAHILECSARQFEQGDVLHWWHPPSGRGVRTRCSDDLLWLVYATSRYVAATGDTAILDETVAFLSAPLLAEDEDDRYTLFEPGDEIATVFEHCRRAMDRGVTSGVHGLPLIGAGDWNDGMDRVGIAGRGESVWLAWFASVCAEGFADLASRHERQDLARLWRERANTLRVAADREGWDGEWYARAFDDDGVPWGSSQSDECQIDSISQSWAVLAGGGTGNRPARAVNAAMDRLVEPGTRLVRLLTPPFDRTERDPGYIRAYPPGIRENGGQYTHAATWLGLAQARLRDGDLAYHLFDLINPIKRASTAGDALLYRAEPYVMPADVGGAAPFEGRAGWTWYTGAAGWAWQLGVEGILGLRLVDGKLAIDPCLPKAWGGYSAVVSGRNGNLEIVVDDPDHTGSGVSGVLVDGVLIDGSTVAFPTDETVRIVEVRLGTT